MLKKWLNSRNKGTDGMTQALENWKKEIEECDSLKALDDIRVRLLGKTGEITALLKTLGTLQPEERKERGAEINQLKDAVQEQLAVKRDKLNAGALTQRLAT